MAMRVKRGVELTIAATVETEALGPRPHRDGGGAVVAGEGPPGASDRSADGSGKRRERRAPARASRCRRARRTDQARRTSSSRRGVGGRGHRPSSAPVLRSGNIAGGRTRRLVARNSARAARRRCAVTARTRRRTAGFVREDVSGDSFCRNDLRAHRRLGRPSEAPPAARARGSCLSAATRGVTIRGRSGAVAIGPPSYWHLGAGLVADLRGAGEHAGPRGRALRCR